MIVCFDTSALNQLMDDPEGDRLTAVLLRDFDVYITALNIIEHTCPLKPGSVGTAMLGRLTLKLLHGLLTLRRSIGSRGNEGAERRGRP
jgi:hypothetical protein